MCLSVWVCICVGTYVVNAIGNAADVDFENKLYNKMVCVFVRVCVCLHVVNGIGNAVGFDSKKMLYTLKDIVCV